METNNRSDLIIESQVCGCPCADSRIVSGVIEIPSSIKKQYPNISLRELNLSGNSPFRPYNIEVAQSKVIIMGNVVEVDTVYCDANNCEIVPIFMVDKWILESYVFRFWTWDRIPGLLYILGLPLIFIGLLVYTFLKRSNSNY